MKVTPLPLTPVGITSCCNSAEGKTPPICNVYVDPLKILSISWLPLITPAAIVVVTLNVVLSLTTIFTVSAMLLEKGATDCVSTNANVMRVSASTCCDVKVGLTTFSLGSSTTPVAVTSTQVGNKGSPSGSELPVPSRVTKTPSFTT